MSSYDTPPAEEVFQTDNEGTLPVSVKLDGSVRVNELPARLGAIRRIVFPVGGRAEQIATEDPRRKRLTINSFNQDFIIAATEAEANAFQGYIVVTGFGIPHHFDFADEIWARPTVIDTTGTTISFGVSTDTAILSIVAEQWAR